MLKRPAAKAFAAKRFCTKKLTHCNETGRQHPIKGLAACFLFMIHFRPAIPKQSPGKPLFHQLIQIKLRRNHAFAVPVHGYGNLSRPVRNKRGSIESKRRLLVSVFRTRLNGFRSNTVRRDHRHQIRRRMALHHPAPMGHTVHGKDRFASDRRRII